MLGGFLVERTPVREVPIAQRALGIQISSPAERAYWDRSWQAGLRGGFYDLERRIIVAGTVKWVRERAELEFDPQGRLLGGVGTTLDITDQKRAEQELAESRAQLASVVELAMDAVIAVDAGQRIVLFNAAAEAMYHYLAAEVIGQPLDKLIPERFRKAHARHIQSFATTGVTSRTLGRLGSLSGLRAGSEEFPVEASIAQAEANGRQLFTVILRDITERKQAEERQLLLTAELDHRVKNVLANVSAVARMSSRGAQSVPDFAEALASRLQAMAAAHTMLQRGGWEGANLADLISHVLAPFSTHAGNIKIEGEPITVCAKATQSLALVLQELVTNAVKYGALSVPDGRVSVGWWRVDGKTKPAHVPPGLARERRPSRHFAAGERLWPQRSAGHGRSPAGRLGRLRVPSARSRVHAGGAVRVARAGCMTPQQAPAGCLARPTPAWCRRLPGAFWLWRTRRWWPCSSKHCSKAWATAWLAGGKPRASLGSNPVGRDRRSTPRPQACGRRQHSGG